MANLLSSNNLCDLVRMSNFVELNANERSLNIRNDCASPSEHIAVGVIRVIWRAEDLNSVAFLEVLLLFIKICTSDTASLNSEFGFPPNYKKDIFTRNIALQWFEGSSDSNLELQVLIVIDHIYDFAGKPCVDFIEIIEDLKSLRGTWLSLVTWHICM